MFCSLLLRQEGMNLPQGRGGRGGKENRIRIHSRPLRLCGESTLQPLRALRDFVVNLPRIGGSRDMAELHAENLRLTDFMDVQTLQEIQDSFAAVANVKAIITDADGNRLTQPAPTSDFIKRQQTLAAAEESTAEGPMKEGREYVAPIIVGGQRLGTIR